jgi:hypothetical protein
MQGLMFKFEMTIANLKGIKTRTSRTKGLDKINEHPDEWECLDMEGDNPEFHSDQDGPYWLFFNKTSKNDSYITVRCPFGKVGSELYGKETYYPCIDADQRQRGDFIYKASEFGHLVVKGEWKSPMMMPETASRYHVILNKIIAQRINDISEDDCIKEGADLHFMQGNSVTWKTYKIAFQKLWDYVNYKSGNGWDKNKWVWGLYYGVRIK